MCKEAIWPLDQLTGAAQDLVGKIPLLLTLPAVLGVAGGAAISKVTSPSEASVKSLQDEFIQEKLRAYTALRERELRMAKERIRKAIKSSNRDILL